MPGLSGEQLEGLARAMHARYAGRREASEPVPAWEQLPACERAANLASARFAPVVLAALGLAVGTTAAPGRRTELTGEEVEAGGRLEHLRWVRFTRASGRTDHPDLVPWGQLSDDVRELDRIRVRDLPVLLDQLGLAVVEHPEEG